MEAGSTQPEAVHIELIEMANTFCGETRDGVTDPGLTIWDFLFGFFFKQAAPATCMCLCLSLCMCLCMRLRACVD